METKKLLRKLLLAVVVFIAAIIIVSLGFWLIDGRSPQAFIVSHSLKKSTMECRRGCPIAREGKDGSRLSALAVPGGKGSPRGYS